MGDKRFAQLTLVAEHGPEIRRGAGGKSAELGETGTLYKSD